MNEPLFGSKTYSQHGDDMMIANLLYLMGVKKPNYLDLGAHHPFEISNTALIYERGARGVNVEANPFLFSEFQKQRPEDVNLNIGVGPIHGQAPFYMYDEKSPINSLKKELVEKAGKVRKEIVIQILTINEIVDKYFEGLWPDFLNSDVEGMDLAILKTADFSKSKPKIICVESYRQDVLTSDAFKHHLNSCGYMCYCRCGENLIFVDRVFEMRVS